MTLFSRHPSAIPVLLYGAAAIFSALSFSYVYSLGLVNALVDAKSHLLQAMQIVHSLTPGVSQIGFWPPMVRIVLLPAVIALPQSLMLSVGSFLMQLPLILLGAYFLHGIVRLCGASPRTAWIAPALFVAHPMVQYYSTSAMTETPFIVMLFGVSFFALKWAQSVSLFDLSMFGVMVSLVSLARFEGFLVLPLATVFVALHCRSMNMPFHKMKAIIISFVCPAVLGLLFIVVYSTAYGGSPWAFLSLGVESTSSAIQPSDSSVRSLTLEQKIWKTLYMYYRASLHMHGYFFVVAFPFAAVTVLAVRRQWRDAFMILFLVSPAIFVMLMMIVGRSSISVAELPRWWDEMSTLPYAKFTNTRYALTWLGAGIFVFTMSLDALLRIHFVRVLAAILYGPVIVLASVTWFAYVFFVQNLSVITLDESTYSIAIDRGEHFDIVSDRYDYGLYLRSRYFNEGSMMLSTIPISLYIHEGNYLYFSQALNEPWLFARWVAVKYATDGGSYTVNGITYINPPNIEMPLRVKILRDMLEMEQTDQFHYYYELVAQDEFTRVYRLRESLLKQHALSIGIDPQKIPSLNQSAEWKPKTFYEDLKEIR